MAEASLTSDKPLVDIQRQVREIKEEIGFDTLVDDLPAVVEGVHKGVKRASAIVQDLRAFARPEAARSKPVDVREAVEAALSTFEKTLPQNVRIVTEIEAGVSVIAHSQQLIQVLINLAQNAVDAMESRPDGQLAIRARSVSGHAEITVSDNGSGMSEDVRSRCFEPFYTTKPVGKGTGLGLAIVHGIIERNGGTVSVRSQPDEGTVLTLELPEPSRDDESLPRLIAVESPDSSDVDGGHQDRQEVQRKDTPWISQR